MKSIEEKSIRVNMVNMHQFFIDKIDKAIKDKRYIEAAWLIYSCMENRFFRVLAKYKNQCIYCNGKSKCDKNTNELALKTKIACVKRLVENNVSCLSNSFTVEQLDSIKTWVGKRNTMMHDLLSLETYQNTDDAFEKSAKEGKKLLSDLYKSCTEFRKAFFAEDYEFVFPLSAMEECRCKPRNNDN